MSGHSKWHSIKHKKAAVDAKRGKAFTKIIKEITVAARMGGGDVNANPRLRVAILKAKDINMPADNIDRAVKKGTGELEGVNYEEMVYEGYGPEGVAFIMDIMTDNKNRTAAEIRKILSKHGGNLGEPGSVAWQFEKRGVFLIDINAIDEDSLMEVVLDAGALDMENDGENYIVFSEVETFEEVKKAIEAKNIDIKSADVTRVPTNTITVSEKKSEKVLNLMEVLEDHDDVQNVVSNVEIVES